MTEPKCKNCGKNYPESETHLKVCQSCRNGLSSKYKTFEELVEAIDRLIALYKEEDIVRANEDKKHL